MWPETKNKFRLIPIIKSLAVAKRHRQPAFVDDNLLTPPDLAAESQSAA